MKAYIDIETTGLSRKFGQLTVVGVGVEQPTGISVVQLYGSTLNRDALMASLEGVTELYSYNGARFDLPFIQAKLDVDLRKEFSHSDLMFACHKRRLMGGLKSVERQLGIQRVLKDVDGFMAVKLYWDYVNNCNKASLQTLLDYNREDVVNLSFLRTCLAI